MVELKKVQTVFNYIHIVFIQFSKFDEGDSS